MALFDVVMSLLNKAGTDTIDPRREDGHGSADENRSYVNDYYADGEFLADQIGTGGVLNFNFSAPVQLVYVFAKSETGLGQIRVNPFGTVDPSASSGIPSDDGIPTAIPAQSSQVKVFAPAGMTVSVWGFRYA